MCVRWGMQVENEAVEIWQLESVKEKLACSGRFRASTGALQSKSGLRKIAQPQRCRATGELTTVIVTTLIVCIHSVHTSIVYVQMYAPMGQQEPTKCISNVNLVVALPPTPHHYIKHE